MLIFLDTTELYKDYRLKKPDFTLLREFLNHCNAKLCIPSIVVEESANHLREAIANDVNQLNSIGRSLQRLIPDYKPVKVDIDPTAEAQHYKKELTESLKYVAKFIPYDDVKVRIVVERALARRKPFDGNGQKGFRDALLWESLLTVLAAEKQPVILITNNTNDFGEHGKLAADLQADVTPLGLEGCPVTVCAGLSAFITEHVKPTMAKLEAIKDQINEGEYESFDADRFLVNHMDYFSDDLRESGRHFEASEFTGDKDATGPVRFSGLKDRPEHWTVVDVWQVDDERIAISLACTLNGSMEYMQGQYYGMAEESWGYGECQADVRFELNLLVVLNPDDPDDYTIEVSEVDVQGR